MRIAFVWFTCVRDAEHVRISYESVAAQCQAAGVSMAAIFAVDGSEEAAFREMAWLKEKGIQMLITDTPRGGSLNGLGFCCLQLLVYRELAERTGADYLVKIDSDVVAVNHRWLQRLAPGGDLHEAAFFGYANHITRPEDAPAPDAVDYRFSSGGTYVMKGEFLKEALAPYASNEHGEATAMKAALHAHNAESCGGYLSRSWPEDETVTSFLLRLADPKAGFRAVLQDPGIARPVPGHLFFTRFGYKAPVNGLDVNVPNPGSLAAFQHVSDFVECRDIKHMRFLPRRADQDALALRTMRALWELLQNGEALRQVVEPFGLPAAAVDAPPEAVTPEVVADPIGYCRIAILIQATGPYLEQAAQLLRSADEHAFPGHQVEYVLFTDREPTTIRSPRDVHYVRVAHREVPWVTALRFHQFIQWIDLMEESGSAPYTHVVYLDADSVFHQAITPEELFAKDAFAVMHPTHDGTVGDAWMGEGSRCALPRDTSWGYVCGAFYGGTWDAFSHLCVQAGFALTYDLSRGLLPKWHDESALNAVLASRMGPYEVAILDSGYCWQRQAQASHRYPRRIENKFDQRLKEGDPWCDYWNEHPEIGENGQFEDWVGGAMDPSRVKVIELALAQAPEKLLDLGCGAGTLGATLAAAPEGDGVCYLGMDGCSWLVEKAREAGHQVMQWSLSQPLPVRTRSVDVVVLRHVLEHLPAYERVLHQALRVAKAAVYVVWFRPPVLGRPIKRRWDGIPHHSWDWEGLRQFLLAHNARWDWHEVGHAAERILEIKPMTQEGAADVSPE